jgi:hypothetical protein
MTLIINLDSDSKRETVEYTILERDEGAGSVRVQMRFGRPELVSQGHVRFMGVKLKNIGL